MRFHLHLYRRLIGIQVRSQMQYRASFFWDLISTGVLNASYFVAMALAVQNFGSIGGWGLGDLAFLVGMAEISFGLMDMLFSGFDPDSFSPLIRLGRFDQFLLRPIDITVQMLGSRFILRRLGRVMGGAAIFLFSLSLSHVIWTPAKVLYLPLIIAGLVMAFGALFIIGATLIFWTVQPLEAVNIVTYGGNEMISYPMHIYPDVLQRIFTYILPLMFMNYLPACFILDKPDPLGFPEFTRFLSPLLGILMLWVALRFWKFGIKHYQGSGS
ncbi:MAG TPA: ABC-2 family transporter protein [Anaerolineaceae bacterium]|nr:ABC-2 family transporter protein [Anaerolineaceae bacterium]